MPGMGSLRRLSPVPAEGDPGRAVALAAPRRHPRPSTSGCARPRKLVRSPELGELRAFCAATDLGSIGNAARLLQVSQPALSKRLRTLEAVAGTQLLRRSSRGVSLTSAGADLYSAARRLLDEADAVQSLMSGFSVEIPPVRVAADPTIAETWLPAVLADLHRDARHHLAVEVIAANSAVVRRMIHEGRSDIGLAEIDPDSARAGTLTERVLWEDEVIVAVPTSHAWAAEREIDPAEFTLTPVIRRDPGASASQVVDLALARAGVPSATPLVEIGSTSAAVAIALTECAPVLLSETALSEHAHRGLVACRVRGIRFQQRFGVIFAGWVADLTPPARILARHLLEERDRALDAGEQ
jgi:DNA-binding transcriptional LysR family regulator